MSFNNPTGNYPTMSQSELDNAPFNQDIKSEKEIEVTVSITLSKTLKVRVSDYEITNSGKDEDGNYFEDIDYSNCNLKNAVEEQIVLPQNAHLYIIPKSAKDIPVINDLKNWCVDDFEVLSD